MDTESDGTDGLFFQGLVLTRVEGNRRFVRREWLAAQVNEELAKAGKPFVLLTAEPGAGKSAFMAQLAHDHPDWLRYFIRRGQGEPLADVSARSLLLRVGYQLLARHPELFPKEQSTLSVKEHIGEVAEHGEVVAVEVDKLIISAFSKMKYEIEQQAQVIRGKLVGFRAKEMYIEERSLPTTDLLHLALMDPARELLRLDPGRQLVILIDALDEIRYQPIAENILSWLTDCPDLPDNIRFVLTSRPPDSALRHFCERQALRVTRLAISEEDDNVTRDVAQFIAKWVGEPALAKELDASLNGAAAFAAKVTARASGNLGYLDALARGMDQAFSEMDAKDELIRHRGRRTLDGLLSLKELPAGLGGLYGLFLNQIRVSVTHEYVEALDPDTGKTKDKLAWPAVYHPMLGVLAVAMEPLGLDLIAKLGDIAAEPQWVRPALDQLRQFLDIVDGRYRLYHSTVAEFLTAEATSANEETADLYQDALQWHKRIVGHYWSNEPADWATCDDYGLYNLASHLSALQSDARYRSRLYEFVSCPVAVAKWQRIGSLVSFGKDLSIAKQAAAQETPLNWGDFMRCYLIERTLSSPKIGADVVRFIALCVKNCAAPADTRKVINRMLESASAIRTSSEKAGALSAIASFLFQAGYGQDARDVVQRALDEAASIESVQAKSETLSTIVLDIATIQDRERAEDVARQALAIAQSTDFSWAKAIAVSAVASALGKLGDEAIAKEAFSQAHNAAWDVKDNDDRAYALCAVAAAMERAGDANAQYVFRDAISQLYGSGMPPEEIEDEFRAIYVDYRARSGRDLDSLFGEALEIKDRDRRQAALRILAARLAKSIVDGDYPPGSQRESDVNRLCDRTTFLRIAAEDLPPAASGEPTLTLRSLCEALVEGAPWAPVGVSG